MKRARARAHTHSLHSLRHSLTHCVALTTCCVAGPSAETGSAGAQDSVSDSEVSTGADSEALAQRHTLAETQTQDAEGQRPSAEPGTIKEGRSEQAARDADEQARGWQNASGQQPGVTGVQTTLFVRAAQCKSDQHQPLCLYVTLHHMNGYR